MTLYTSVTEQRDNRHRTYYPTDSGRPTYAAPDRGARQPYVRFVPAASRPRENTVIPEGNTVTRRRVGTASVYGWVTLLSVVFCLIYEHFSFGEHADSMRLMFLLPLVGGVLPFSLLGMTGRKVPFSLTACRLWHSGIAVLMSGCLVKGIIEIAGRVSDYDVFYAVTGGLMLAAAFAVSLVSYSRKKADK